MVQAVSYSVAGSGPGEREISADADSWEWKETCHEVTKRIPIIHGKKVNEDLQQAVVERHPRRASLMQSSNVWGDFLNNSIRTTAPKGKL